jgi:predicted HicB family RNase H-like nuclease
MASWSNGRWTRRPIKSRSKMISFRVTMDEMQSLELEADRRQISVSVLVRQALERMLDQRTA